MTLRNAFGDLALEETAQATQQAVEDVVDAVEANTAAVGETEVALDLLGEQVILLRRLIKLMESQATVDNLLRQRITLDAIASGLTLGTVTTVTGVTTVTTTGTVTTVNQHAGVDLRWQWMENARLAYNAGVRARLS